ncbi:unnamed protein product [Effrenium voratum]|nr:unnamed protein product [Effrenium voratum]
MHHRLLFPLLILFSGVAYVQYRVRILRWDSANWQGTKGLHACQSVYWCIPLGLLAATWERASKKAALEDYSTGWHAFVWHCMAHFIFLRFVLPGLEPSVPSSELSYEEALSQLGGRAGMADYLNTNPVEVLKSHFSPEPCTGLRLIYYRSDKEYLQARATKFAGDDDAMASVFNAIHKDAGSVVTDVMADVTSMSWNLPEWQASETVPFRLSRESSGTSTSSANSSSRGER